MSEAHMMSYSDPCEDVIDDSEPQPAAVVFRMCNFATGNSALLPSHMKELQDKILDTSWPHCSGWIDIVGYASKLQYAHNPQGNYDLSVARWESVKSYLGSALPRGFRFNVIQGEGDGPAKGASADAGFFRAVLVRLFAQLYSPPPRIKTRQPIPQPQPSASNQFMFEAVSIYSAGIEFAQSDELLFKLTDMTNHQSRYFRYGVAYGPNLSWPPVSKSSASDSKERPIISTPFALRDLSDFESPDAELGQISDGKSFSKLRLGFKPNGFLRR